MGRYRWIFVALLAMTGVARGAERPNIVLILSDDQAWTDYSFMGHPAIRTPRLDRLAESGAVFRRGYVPTALCSPSLATIATGRYAHDHGITGNDPSRKNAPRGSEEYRRRREQLIKKVDALDTLPRALARRGYVSHQSGKWWLGGFRRGGFTEGMTRGFPEPGGRHGDDGLTIGREGLEPIFDFVDRALADDQPFFVWYAPFMPHTPHTPPERILKKYRDGRPLPVAKYFAMCEWFDETCGELIDGLERRGARENTLIVYICDNGWIQDPERDNRFAPRSKQTPFEGGVRQPTIYSWPSRIAPQDRPELATSLDIYPTILAAAGPPVGEVEPSEADAAREAAIAELPGLNLLPRLTEPRPIERDTIFGEAFAHDIADLNDPNASLLFHWVIEGDWKLIATRDGEAQRYASANPRADKRPLLFNLRDDPSEQTNLAEEFPEKVKALRDKIDKWWGATADP